MLYFLENTELSVKHVGNNSYSQLTANQLNHKVQKKDKLESVNRVLVVAELTTNHFGDRLRLEKMIRSSKAAGADYIKLQKRDVETFYSSQQLKTPYLSPFGKTFADYRHQLELSIDDFEFVSKLCRELNIGWFCSVLDQNSFNFIKELNPSIIKLPSTISEHEDYLRYVSNNFRGGIILSTGMTDENYEKFVLENFKQCEELYLLQCNSAYPTPMYDCNIGVVRHYHELSLRYKHIRPGYSSHDIGWLGSALAVAAGAKMLEKHVKYGSTEWAHFDGVAVDLSTNDFKNYVDKIRDVELVVGSGKKAINKSEHHKYRRKS
jgi:N-acetylneuraminate synthase